MTAGAALVVRWSPEQQVCKVFIEAVEEVMSPDKLNTDSGSGWMGAEPRNHRRSSRDGLCTSVRSRHSVRCSPTKRCRSAYYLICSIIKYYWYIIMTKYTSAL